MGNTFFGKHVLQPSRNPSARGSHAAEQEQVSCLGEMSSPPNLWDAGGWPPCSPAWCLLPLHLDPSSSSELQPGEV